MFDFTFHPEFQCWLWCHCSRKVLIPSHTKSCLLIIASSNCSAISHSDGFLNKEVRRWVKEMIFFSLAFWHHLGWVSVARGCGLNMFSVENAWLLSSLWKDTFWKFLKSSDINSYIGLEIKPETSQCLR